MVKALISKTSQNKTRSGSADSVPGKDGKQNEDKKELQEDSIHTDDSIGCYNNTYDLNCGG